MRGSADVPTPNLWLCKKAAPRSVQSLNGTPAAAEIPAATQERILAAAQKFNYRPNALARLLRGMRSHTVGVLVPEISDPYGALVLGALGDYLLSKGYFFFVAIHCRKVELLDEYPELLRQRSVEGFILIDTALEKPLPLPTRSRCRFPRIPSLPLFGDKLALSISAVSFQPSL